MSWNGTTCEKDENGGSGRFPGFMLAAAVAVYGLILTGSYVTAAGATAACTTWPLCQGNIFPTSTLQAIHMGHRLATLVFGLFVLYSLHLGFRGDDRLRGVKFLAMAATTIFILQVAAGAATVWLDFAMWLRALHLSLATALWGFVAGLAALTHATSRSRHTELSHD